VQPGGQRGILPVNEFDLAIIAEDAANSSPRVSPRIFVAIINVVGLREWEKHYFIVDSWRYIVEVPPM